MKKFFDGILKFFAVLFAIVFVATAVLALLLFNVEQRIFNKNLYLDALEKQGIYERLPAILGEVLSSSASFNSCATNPIACQMESRTPEAVACFEKALGAETYDILSHNQRPPTEEELRLAQPCLDQYPPPTDNAGGPPPFMKSLSAKDWEKLISALLPPEELKSMTTQALTGVFEYLNGESDSVRISLVPLKERLSGPAGTQAALTLIKAQPPCTLEQIATLTLTAIGGGEGIVLCSPPEELLAGIQPLIEQQLAGVAADIPDEATLVAPSTPGAQDALGGLQTIRLVMRLSPLIPLAFLLLVTIFAVRSLEGWLRWWGIPLLIVGLLGAIASELAASLFQWTFDNFIAGHFPTAMPQAITDLARKLSTTIVSGIATPILIQSIVLLVVGIGMVVAAYFYLKNRSPQS